MLIDECCRTTAVLFSEKESAQSYKNRVAYVVAHELAHQWFGNLVTMDWWNEVSNSWNTEAGVIALLTLNTALVERGFRNVGRMVGN